MSHIEYAPDGTSVTIPVALFNIMAQCFYGTGPRLHERMAMHKAGEVEQPPPGGEAQLDDSVPVLHGANIKTVLPPVFQPKGLALKKMGDNGRRDTTTDKKQADAGAAA
jgi:hypothetical protein